VISTDPSAAVVGGSVTISAGGSAITSSGDVISVLPSGSGVVVQPAQSASSRVVVVGGTALLTAGGTATTISDVGFSVLPSGQGVQVVSSGLTSTVLADETDTAVGFDGGATTIAGIEVSVALPQPSAIVIGASITLASEAPVATVSDVQFSLLSSGQGVQIVSSGITSTLARSDRVATTIAGVQVSAALPQPSAVVIGESLTLASNIPVATVSGVHFSLLPLGQGVQVVSAGSTTTITASSETTVAGFEVSPVEPETATTLIPATASGFVLGGSTTLFADGPAATVSGTVYSVLPANIVEVVSGTITQYVVGGSSTISSDSPATVSGTVYSVLPSGSGVVIVVSSRTTTVVATGTGTGGTSKATPSVDIYTGSASTGKKMSYTIMVAVVVAAAYLTVV